MSVQLKGEAYLVLPFGKQAPQSLEFFLEKYNEQMLIPTSRSTQIRRCEKSSPPALILRNWFLAKPETTKEHDYWA